MLSPYLLIDGGEAEPCPQAGLPGYTGETGGATSQGTPAFHLPALPIRLCPPGDFHEARRSGALTASSHPAGWNELLIASFSHRSVSVQDGILLATGLHVHRSSAHSAGVGSIFDRCVFCVVVCAPPYVQVCMRVCTCAVGSDGMWMDRAQSRPWLEAETRRSVRTWAWSLRED